MAALSLFCHLSFTFLSTGSNGPSREKVRGMRCPGLYCGLIDNATRCGVSVVTSAGHLMA